MKQKKYYLTKHRKQTNIQLWILLIAVISGVAIIGISAISMERAIDRINIQEVSKGTPEGQIMAQNSPQILHPTKQQVEDEIRRQAKQFSLGADKMVELALCESGLDYKAKNPNSTARGTFQYLIRTWEETVSAKKGYERNNYMANIREAMIDISNGEVWKWEECAKIIGLI